MNNNSKNKMLIDATHPEETRVVVLRNGRIEEFDWESASRKLLRGNIYLAKVTRVEPSLQAAFVDYGGNRHGFLAFSEIHPDYYQIPMADRQALLEEEAEAEEAKAKAEEAEDEDLSDDEESDRGGRGRNGGRSDRRDGRRDDRQGGRREARDPDSASAPEHEPQQHAGEATSAMPDAAGDASHQHAPDTPRHAESEQPAYPAPEPWSPPAAEPPTQSHDASSSAGLSISQPTLYDAPSARTSAPDMPAPPSHDDHGHRGSHDRSHEGHGHEGHGHEGHGNLGEHRVEHLGEPASPEDRRPEPGDAEDLVIRTSADEIADIGSRVVEVVEPEGSGATEVETVGSEDVVEEIPDRPRRYARQYKIQEVIRRRQIILVQVVKEERGNKGAALTTYLSLAGRYTVLMPNTARGGGISRKIANSADRKRLRKIVTELEVPKGMGLIVRTAGASRTKAEIKRDFEYLLRLWESVRDLTLRSTAPTLVYEEGDLIKRSIRDLYSKEIEDINVAGEQAYSSARDFMQMLMPSHVGNVVPYRAPEPLFTRYQIERQLNALFSPFVTLRSGGYIVINQTEALVSIDINSGKSTREHNIEDTALKTNLEASEEIARQLKLRDLAGLIVIDYIDMEEKRNNRAVERRLKESLRHDRARIQVGRISHFGLLEMSRQRLRPGVLEGSTSQCPHCQGTGTIRSTESVALAVLRGIEDKMMAGDRFNVVAQTTADVALYILNQKRHFLNDMEGRYGVTISIMSSDKVHGANFIIERGPAIEERQPARRADVVQMDASHHGVAAGSWDSYPEDEEPAAEDNGFAADDGDEADAGAEAGAEAGADGGSDEARANGDGNADSERRGRRRRRRRRGGRPEGAAHAQSEGSDQPGGDLTDNGSEGDDARISDQNGHADVREIDSDMDVDTVGDDAPRDGDEDAHDRDDERRAQDGDQGDAPRDGEGRRRRRGRRGGRRGGRDREGREASPDRPQAGQREPEPHGEQHLPIARPDEWMHHEPTVGEIAASQHRAFSGGEQPSYYAPATHSTEAQTTSLDADVRRFAEPSTYPQVMGGSSGHVVPAANVPAEVHPAVDSHTHHGAPISAERHERPEPVHYSTPAAEQATHTSAPAATLVEQTPTAEATASNGHQGNGHQASLAPELMPEAAPVEPPPPPEPPRPRRTGWWSRR